MNKTKICSACRILKNLEDFYIDRSKNDGRRHCCKLCDNKRVRLWMFENRERVNAYSKKYMKLKYAENPKKFLKRNRDWYNKNKVAINKKRKLKREDKKCQ